MRWPRADFLHCQNHKGTTREESITLYNRAMVREALGDRETSEAELEPVVALNEAIDHPDLESDRDQPERIRALCR